MNKSNTPYNKNGVSITQFEIRASLLIDVYNAPKKLLDWNTSWGNRDLGPWNRVRIAGNHGIDHSFNLNLTDASLPSPGLIYQQGSFPSNNKFREVEVTYEAIHTLGTYPGEEASQFSEEEEIEGAKEIGEKVADSIPSHLPNYKYIQEVARAAAEAGAKMGYKKAREER